MRTQPATRRGAERLCQSPFDQIVKYQRWLEAGLESSSRGARFQALGGKKGRAEGGMFEWSARLLEFEPSNSSTRMEGSNCTEKFPSC